MSITMKCKNCGEDLASGDYGYYCEKQECELYDKEFSAYELEEREGRE